ncbi:MAG: hypothetical protein GJU73_04800 [Ferrovum sp.]|jgi:hypothetical protein|uniref:hypothetical protein n=1 Tax=Ferrovum sp. TaxID=2609467 RepID=UPI002618FF81|nr:hypothetical protein [Ferrovum sp.]MBW8066747.1 hypothetical protein [Ferrovum sp.]
MMLNQLVEGILRDSGFVQQRMKNLWDITRKEWKRTRGADEPAPEIPENIGYVKRLPDVGALQSELAKLKIK